MHREPRTMAEIKSRQTDRRRRAKQIALRVVMALILLAAMAAALLLSSCSTDDDRDICCEETLILVRYIRNAGESDSYRQFIKSSRHFIFDSTGVLLSQNDVTGTPEELLLKVELEPGHYTLLVLGNQTEKTDFYPVVGKTRLSDMLMVQNTRRTDGFYDNGDRLYWGILPFDVEKNKRKKYICDMSNIHCRMRVTVRWKNNTPTMLTGYSCRLYHIPAQYRDSGRSYITLYDKETNNSGSNPSHESTDKRIIHSFPQVVPTHFADHELPSDMHYAELDVNFITFRYTNEYIPSFRVYHGNTPLMKEIQLNRFFKEQGWVPDLIPEQRFHIIVEIDPITGKVTVTAAPNLNVADWVDGGIIKVES